MSDLTAAMRLYRESAIPQTKGSDETPDAMLVAIKELYRRAQDEASTAVAAERAALAAAQESVEAFRQELLEIANDVEVERDQARAALESAEIEIGKLKEGNAFAKGRVAQLEVILQSRWTTAHTAKSEKA